MLYLIILFCRYFSLSKTVCFFFTLFYCHSHECPLRRKHFLADNGQKSVNTKAFSRKFARLRGNVEGIRKVIVVDRTPNPQWKSTFPFKQTGSSRAPGKRNPYPMSMSFQKLVLNKYQVYSERVTLAQWMHKCLV